MEIIAHIKNDYMEKFGIPRQSGLVSSQDQYIVFEKKYSGEDWIRGIEQFSHLWLIWIFSEVSIKEVGATVRPPRLGGNTKIGVFATRSPFRPNPIGLTCVSLKKIVHSEKEGNILVVRGADLMNETPIIDIKPYIPYADSYPDAKSGFADTNRSCLKVSYEERVINKIEKEKRQALIEVLAQDPRPSYQNDESRIYGMKYSNKNIKFKVKKDTVFIIDIEEAD